MTRPNAASLLYHGFRNQGHLSFSPNDEREHMYINMYRRKLTEMAMSRFMWDGMPESIDLRFFEHTLFYRGLVVVFFDVNVGAILAARARPEGNFNLYDNPKWFWAYGANYAGKRLRQDECAPVWGTITRMGTDNDIVEIYAHRLAELDRTIEINSKNARRPKAIAVNEEEVLSVDNIIASLDRGDPVIKVTNPLVLDRIERTLDFGVDPKSIEILSVVRARVVNECMSMLGIDNANQDKKERLVAAEVDANGEQIDMGKRANLIPREQGAILINRVFGEKYGFEVTVRNASDVEEVNDGNVYDNAGGDAGELSDSVGNVGGNSKQISSV